VQFAKVVRAIQEPISLFRKLLCVMAKLCVCMHVSSYIHLGYACSKQNVSLYKNYNCNFKVLLSLHRATFKDIK